MDVPGFRDFTLSHIPKDSLAQTFKEFLPFIGHCRFRNCQHQHEPGCALKQAVKNGEIAPSRWDSYEKLR